MEIFIAKEQVGVDKISQTSRIKMIDMVFQITGIQNSLS